MLHSQASSPHSNAVRNQFFNKNNNQIDLTKCQIHRQVHTIRSGTLTCQCCNYPKQMHLKIKDLHHLNVCFPLSVLSYLGPGTILYFLYIKLAILFMAVGCIFSIPMLIMNSLGTACQQIIHMDCNDSYLVKISVVNLFNDPQKILIQTYILSSVIILMIILNILARRKMRMVREDQKNIIFDNIWQQQRHQQELNQQIETEEFRHQQKRVQKYAVLVKDKKGLLNFQYLKNHIRYWWELEQENFKDAAFIDKKVKKELSDRNKKSIEMGEISAQRNIFSSSKNRNRQQLQQLQNSPLSFAPKIQFQFQNILMKMANPIETTIYCFNMQTFLELKDQFEQIEQELKAGKNLTDEDIHKKMTRIEQIRDIIQSQKLQSTNKGIIIFKHPLICQLFLSRFSESGYQKFLAFRNIFPCLSENQDIKTRKLLQMKNKLIQLGSYEFEEAPFPSQIIWKNHHHSSNQKISRRIIIWVSFFILLTIGEGILVGILAIWFGYVKGNEQNITSYFSTIVALAISLTNVGLYQLFFILTKYEWYPTTPKLHISRAYKIITITFLNSGLLLLFAYLIFDYQSIWVYGGFIDTLTYSFIYSVFLPPIAKYINMRFILHFYYRIIFYYRGTKQQKRQKQSKQDQNQRLFFYSDEINQKEANQLTEKPIEYPEFQYAYLCMTILWASFFAPITPISFPLILISFFILYWIQKTNLLYLLSQPRPSSGILNEHMLGVLQKAPFFMAAGNLTILIIIVVGNQTGGKSFTASIAINSIVLFLTLYSFLLPNQAFNKLITCQSKQKYQIFDKINSLSKDQKILFYSNMQDTFYTTYQNESPVHSFKKKVKILFTRNVTKMSTFSRRHNKSLKVIQQLNTMSKSLEQTLKDRLFNKDLTSTSKIYQTMQKAEQEQSSFDYEYEQKVQMPIGKTKRADIPTLFRAEPRSKRDEQNSSVEIQRSNSFNRSKVQTKMRVSELEIQEQRNMIPLKKLFSAGQNEIKMKQLFKMKIKESIEKFK